MKTITKKGRLIVTLEGRETHEDGPKGAVSFPASSAYWPRRVQMVNAQLCLAGDGTAGSPERYREIFKAEVVG